MYLLNSNPGLGLAVFSLPLAHLAINNVQGHYTVLAVSCSQCSPKSRKKGGEAHAVTEHT